MYKIALMQHLLEGAGKLYSLSRHVLNLLYPMLKIIEYLSPKRIDFLLILHLLQAVRAMNMQHTAEILEKSRMTGVVLLK
jgi:hypothetical protein